MTDVGIYSLDEDNVVIFGFGNTDRLVEGPEEALQVVAHHLFQTPGSCAYNRDEGGGLQKLIGGNLRTKSEVRTEAVIIINRAMRRIRESQSQDKDLSATVTGLRLLDARVVRDKALTELRIRIDLADGNSFQTTFRVT